MYNVATANEANLEALESYFEKYPDAPRETILKQHLLSVGHWFSDAALEAAAGALVKSYRLFSYDLVPMAELKRGEHRRVPEHFVLLKGPYDLRPVAIQTSLSPHSPYLVNRDSFWTLCHTLNLRCEYIKFLSGFLFKLV